MFSLEDDPRFFEGGVPTLEMFCSYHVEASTSLVLIASDPANRLPSIFRL